MTLEICCTSLASAKIAEENGATRIELCDNILEGGTTPSAGLIAAVKEGINIPLHVLIRPRGGDFCYTDEEFRVIKLDIAACLELGVDGIVCGVLNSDNTIDQHRTLTLVEMCGEIDFTFHRAFDLVPDQILTLQNLNDLGVKRVLTSGGQPNVGLGAKRLGKLIKQSGDEIEIIAGGGLNHENINILLELGCRAFHTTAKTWLGSGKSGQVCMNAMPEIQENRFMQASAEEIALLLEKISTYNNAQ
jgi:copper homeostasis protein